MTGPAKEVHEQLVRHLGTLDAGDRDAKITARWVSQDRAFADKKNLRRSGDDRRYVAHHETATIEALPDIYGVPRRGVGGGLGAAAPPVGRGRALAGLLRRPGR